jgi:hypothetical protein
MGRGLDFTAQIAVSFAQRAVQTSQEMNTTADS